jgi:hypothetical protein
VFCSLMYPACNAHAPYSLLWSVPLYNIFPHHLVNGTIFERRLLNIKRVFRVFLQLLSETFFTVRELSEMWTKIDIGLHVKYLLFLPNINGTRIFPIDFLKTLKYQISWKSVQWEPSCSTLTDRHDEANSRFFAILRTGLKMIKWPNPPHKIKSAFKH